MKRTLTLLSLLALGTAAAQKTVTVGWSGAITGPTSDAGASYAAGVEDYCKWANAQNTVPGVKVNCVVKDDQYNNANTQRNFEDYVGNQNAVSFLAYSTGGAMQLKNLVQETKVPTLPASYHIGLVDPPNNDYMFLPISSYSEQVVALLEHIAKEKPGAKVALVVNPSPFGRAVVEDAKRAAERLRVKIADVQEVGGNNLDNTALLKRLEGQGVQYVINQNTAGPVANILKDAKRLGLLNKMQFMGAHYTGGDDLTNLAGDAAENFVWTTAYYLPEEENQAGVKFIKQLGKDSKRPDATVRSVHYMSGALAASIVFEALKRQSGKGNLTAQSVHKGLLSMNGNNKFDPGFTVSPVVFTEKDHVGAEGLRLLQVKNGQFKAISEPFQSKLFRLVHK